MVIVAVTILDEVVVHINAGEAGAKIMILFQQLECMSEIQDSISHRFKNFLEGMEKLIASIVLRIIPLLK